MIGLDEKIALLKKTHNMIFTGAPGTGKTFLARQIALKMITGKLHENDLSDERADPDDKSERDDYNSRYRLVQFHPSYDYTDFVEGLRPKSKEGGELGFELKDGIFKKFCKDALDHWKTWKNILPKFPETAMPPYVFVIDEINRGEISKIFGELFFSIDPGYRGKDGRVQTQYTNIQSGETKTIFDEELGEGWFYVPENVYIIGTMNDIDRSVESFDFAMRRRFVWEEITAEESAGNMKLSEGAKKRMTALNNAIQGIEGLSPSYHIGAAYFLVKDENDKTMTTEEGIAAEPNQEGFPASYDKLWEYRLKPLLFEYVRGTPSADESMDKLKNAFDTAGNG